MPYDSGSMRSIYHIREYNIRRLSLVREPYNLRTFPQIHFPSIHKALISSSIPLPRLAPINRTLWRFKRSPSTKAVPSSGCWNGRTRISAFDGSFTNDTARVVVLRSLTCAVWGYSLSWWKTAAVSFVGYCCSVRTSFYTESRWDCYRRRRFRRRFYGNKIDNNKRKLTGNSSFFSSSSSSQLWWNRLERRRRGSNSDLSAIGSCCSPNHEIFGPG